MNQQLLKTSGADVLPSKRKVRKTLRGVASTPPPPLYVQGFQVVSNRDTTKSSNQNISELQFQCTSSIIIFTAYSPRSHYPKSQIQLQSENFKKLKYESKALIVEKRMYLGLIGNCIQYINIKHANNTPQPKLPAKTAVSFKSFTSHIQRCTSTLKVAVWSHNKELKTRL